MKNLVHYADILAIPFFLLSFIYFYKKEKKNRTERILLCFSLVGLIMDTYFTYNYIFFST